MCSIAVTSWCTARVATLLLGLGRVAGRAWLGGWQGCRRLAPARTPGHPQWRGWQTQPKGWGGNGHMLSSTTGTHAHPCQGQRARAFNIVLIGLNMVSMGFDVISTATQCAFLFWDKTNLQFHIPSGSSSVHYWITTLMSLVFIIWQAIKL